MSRRRVSALCGIIVFVSLSCSMQRGSVATIPTELPKSGTRSDSVASARSSDPLNSRFFEGDPKGAEAWRQFINKGEYRLAQPEDFQFSDGAKKQLRAIFGEQWETRAFNPYTGGNINHDQFYHDYAYIVVDRAKSDSRRFGLVIFNEEAGDRPHTAYWLYKDRNLSSVVFGWASSGLHIEEYDTPGKAAVCYVNWNSAHQTYSCGASSTSR